MLTWTQVQEVVIDYTDCTRQATSDWTTIPSNLVQTAFRSQESVTTPQWQTSNKTVQGRRVEVCELEFTIPTEFKSPVYLFYRLTNFYQNHRRYVKSLDEGQLRGDAVSAAALSSSETCSPLVLDPETKKPFYPCGLIANSIFNDTFTTPINITPKGKAGKEAYVMSPKGIAWSSDRDRYKKSKYKPEDVMPPLNWREKYANYTEDNFPDISQMEEFQVWMRTAGLPTFSKLALRNDTHSMPKGTYVIEIVSRMTSLLTKY